jgi:predicted nucleotidyltransferase
VAEPSWRHDREAVLTRFIEACSNDDRITAAFLAGSFARGGSDEHSDLDLCVVVADEAAGQMLGDRERLTALLGGVLEGVTFPWPDHDRTVQAEELGSVVTWFWHDLSHFAAAIDRQQLWWAAGQLEQLRGYCVRLARVEHGAEPMPEEPYWKLDAEMPTASLEPLRSTFVPMERQAMLEAARELLAFFRSRAPGAAEAGGITYPAALDRLAGGRLDIL